MKTKDWVDNQYTKSIIKLSVNIAIWHRIPQHKRELYEEIKKEIKSLSISNGNVKVVSVMRQK
jgi:hypothetical protein